MPAGARRLRERSGGRQRGDEPEPAHLRRRRVLLAGAVLARRAVQVNCQSMIIIPFNNKLES